MAAWEIFLWGFGGSIAIEIVTAYRILQSQPNNIPEYYKKVSYWILRLLLAVVGGGLAIAYDIQKPLLAANIGAAAPVLLEKFAQGIQKQG